MDARKSDVLILGGGVIGLSCAYFLSRAGMSVRILERGLIGRGASRANCGLITPSHAEPVPRPGVPGLAMKMMFDATAPLKIRPRMDLEFMSWGARFMRHCNEQAVVKAMRAKADILRASRVLTGKLIAAEKMDCNWGEQGMIGVCLTEERFAELRKFAIKAAEFGVPSEVLERAALHQREPALKAEVVGGVLFNQDAMLRPERYLNELGRVLQERGVSIEEDAEVKALNVEQAGVHSAYTERGLFEAKHFVMACGAWSRRLAQSVQLDLPVEPGKGYSITANRRPDPCPRHALLLEERSMAVTPWANGFRLGGTMEFSGFDDSLNKARLNALIEGAEEYLQEPLPPGPPNTWCGFRPMTPDDLPFIGKALHLKNFFLATGHNMLGMSMAASTGRLITEQILGKKPHIDPAPFDPGRFGRNPGHVGNRLRRLMWRK